MTTICTSCGAQNDGGATCHHCGQPLPPAQPAPPPSPPSAPPQPGGYPQQPPPPPPGPPQQPQPPQSGYGAPPLYPQQGGYPPHGQPGMTAPPQPRYNPFLGWPVTDYLRDVAAVFCLFATLGMTWDLSGDQGGEKWWVVIAVLLAVGSLVLPYLLKANVIPGWTPVHSKLAKLGACLPFLASVIAALINELVNLDSDRDGGLGIALGMGMAGIALVLQPRQAEEMPQPTDDGLWNKLAYGFGIAAVVAGVLMYAGLVIHASDDLFDDVLGFFKILLVALVLLLVLAAWPLAGYVGGSAAWRRIFATSLFTVIGVSLLAMADEGRALFYWPQAEKWYGDVLLTGYAGTFLLGAAAGLSVCRSLARRPSEHVEPVGEWQHTASAAALVSAIASVVAVVALIIGIVQDSDELAAAIVVTVLAAITGGCAAVAAGMARQAQQHRVLALVLLGVTVLAGLIAMGVANGQDMNVEGVYVGPALPVTGWLVAAWVSLPVLAICALTVPPSVRAAFGPLIPAQPAYGPPGGHPQQGPPPQGPVPPHGGYPPQPGYGQQPPPPGPPPQPGH
jgi:hypothetical protein